MAMRQFPLLCAVLQLSCLWQVSGLVASERSTTTDGTIVALPQEAPKNSEPLVSTHLSFSLEQDRWPEWAGIEERNEFTHNALVNLEQLTGQPPKIRVGANSEDHTVWSPTVTFVEALFPPTGSITPYPEATSITVGDGYYQLSKWLPAGTHMIWGVNLGLNNVTNAVNMAKSIIKAFSSSEVRSANIHLDLIEVGNEADLYRDNGLRPSNFTQEEYVANWISVAGPVVEAAGLQAGEGTGLQGAAFAGTGYTPTGIINDGILESAPGKVIKQISQHRYSGAFCSGGNFALTSFMSKASVRSNLTLFNADIAEVRSKGLPYVLGETNSIACHGAPGVSNTAGAALWALDYTLQAATLGIIEAYFHEGIGFKYNFIQPVSLNRSTLDGTPLNPPSPPHVQPSYYAAILHGYAVGRSGSASVVELSVAQDNVSGYAIYEHGRLVRAVFVNLDAWLTSSTGTRPSVHLSLDFSQGNGGSPRTATVRRLTIQHADDVSGLTLGGQSYETPDALVSGREYLQKIDVQDGVDISSTEAILLSF